MDHGKPEHHQETANLIGAVRSLISLASAIDADAVNEQLKNLFDNPVQIAEAPKTDFMVLPENWPAIQVFIACQTQWLYLALPDKAIKTGLKYPSVEIVARRRYPAEDQDALFIKIQQIEQHALAIWQDQ